MSKTNGRITNSSETYKKRFLLLNLLLVLALFVFCGGFSLFHLKKAEAANIAPQFFIVNSETSKKIEENVGIRIDRKATSTASEDMYKGFGGVINGLFQTSTATKIEFGFPQDDSSINAKHYVGYEFTFKVEDVSGEGAHFLVKYYYGTSSSGYGKRGRVAVIYVDENGEETYKSSSFDGVIANSKSELEELNTMCLPEIQDKRGANNGPVIGHINLVWDNAGVLSVMAPLYEGESSKTPLPTDSKVVAKFGENSYGLPKVSFPNGYKISFSANGYHSVRFTSIAGVSLSESIDENNTPAWCTAASNITTLVLDGKVENVYPKDTKISFPKANYFTGAGKTGVASGELTLPSGLIRTVKDTMTLTAEGTYTLTYMDDRSGANSNVGRTKSFTFQVSDTPFTDIQGLIETDATLTEVSVERYAGLQITSNSAYSGKIHGVFKNNQDSSVEFLLPTTKGVVAADLDIIFRIEDAVDASKYFEIIYYNTGNSNRRTNAIVRYVDENGKTYYRNCSNRFTNPSAIYTEKNVKLSGNSLIATLPEVGHNSLSGYFALSWEGDVLNVKAPVLSGNANSTDYLLEGTLAKFDGTNSVDASEGKYGLPKISFPNGYKISFTSATKQTILFTEIAGIALGKEFAQNTPDWYIRNNSFVFIELASEISNKYPTNYNVEIPEANYIANEIVKKVEKVELKKEGGAYEVIETGKRIFTEAGSYTLRYTAIDGGSAVGNVQEYSFEIENENEFEIAIEGGGTTYASYPVNYSVEILVAQYKFITNELIAVDKIELKKGNGEYVAIKAGDMVFSEAGNYTLRYTAISGAQYKNNVKECFFEIKKESEYPITIKGGGTEFEKYPVDYSFEVLRATYSLVNENVTNVEKVEIKKNDGAFKEITVGWLKLDEVGTYTLRYTAINGASYVGNTKEFTVDIQPQEGYSVNMTVEGTYKKSYPVHYTFTIFPANYTLITDEVKEVLKIEVSRNGGKFLPLSSGENTFDIVGSYIIRYTAVDKSNYQNNVKTFEFNIVFENVIDSEELKGLFEGDGIDVNEYQVTLMKNQKDADKTLKGLLVGPSADSLVNEYQGAIKGDFIQSTQNDTTIKFLFPNIPSVDTSNFGITFRIEDVSNANNYFEIIYYYVTDSTARVKTRMAVVYNGAFRTTQTHSRYGIQNIWTSREEVESVASPNAARPDVKYDGKEGAFSLLWEGNVLVVKAPVVSATSYNYGEAWDSVIAKFDGTSAVSGTTAFGLPKISFPNGYKIRFSSTSAQPILFTNISGIDLCDDITEDRITATSIRLIQDSIAHMSTKGEVAVKDIQNVGANIEYKIISGTYTVTGNAIMYPNISSVNFKKSGEYQITYSVSGVQSITQKITIVDVPPTLSFADGVWAEETYCKGAENQSPLTISKNDIGHISDSMDGIIDIESVRVYIKGPMDSEYRDYAFGAFNPDNLGLYCIKYVVMDSNGGEGYIVRTINVVDGEIPIIRIETELPTSVVLKQTIILPEGSATSNGQAIELIRSVYFNDKKLEVENNALTFENVGEYVVSYFAKDDSGKENLLRFIYVVEADSVAPTITIGETPKYVLVGRDVILPTYKAIDEVDGEVSVSVKVMFGISEINVNNGKFKIEELGTYSIVFYSSDLSGNIIEEVVDITAVNTLPDGYENVDGGNASEGGCRSSVGCGFGISVLIVFAFLKRKKCDDNNK